mgnify:CR=1 FL=1
MIELCGVSKRLGGFALTDLCLQVPRGEYFVLLGPTGVGKTVLIELIAGLIRPDAGSILWQGRDITGAPPETRRFAVVYQDYALFPHMSVARNIAYGLHRGREATAGAQHSMTDGQAFADSPRYTRRIDELAATFGLTDLLDRRPDTLSGGEQQRAALARALATEPELLLLDEPLAALDPRIRRELRRELARVHRETGATCIHVTHDIEEAMSVGQRIGVMLGGRMRQTGTPDELFRLPSDPEVAEFLGMRNVIAISDTCDGVCRAGDVLIHAACVQEGASYLWVKPEEVLLSREPIHSSARNHLACTVVDWEYSGQLVAVQVRTDGINLVALITHDSFVELGIDKGTPVYAAFKSSAVHCF